jgi:glycerate 2-kinase
VAGANEMLRLLSSAGPDDVAICLLSGGGSALLPAPVEGITLADKQSVTRLLHRCGATIDEMNCVRKHLSAIKGGRLAAAFRGRFLVPLIISDVVGDRLDVIASGPTAPDPTEYAHALIVLEKYALLESVPPAVFSHLNDGAAGLHPETVKECPGNASNCIIGSNRIALDAANRKAKSFGYHVLDLGAHIEGETRELAVVVAGIVRSIQRDNTPIGPPACILLGGETTVSLGDTSGKGGRNQEFVLALLARLGPVDASGVTVLSGGTDGEDGPTDAAGAVADVGTWGVCREKGLSLDTFLRTHDAYHFFERTGGLLRTGLTGTNVMDVRVVLVR